MFVASIAFEVVVCSWIFPKSDTLVWIAKPMHPDIFLYLYSQIARAEGTCAPNRDYLFQLLKELTYIGICFYLKLQQTCLFFADLIFFSMSRDM